MKKSTLAAHNRKLILSERGFSLVEMLISTLVMGLAMAGLYSAFDSTEMFYENYSASSDMRQQARVGIDLVTTELRATGYDIGDLVEALAAATDTSVQFVADIDDGDDSGACDASYENATNGGAERVTYALDTNTGDLVRTIDCYNGTAWTNGVETSTVAQFLDVGGVVFRFYDEDGGQLPSSSGGTLSASDRANVVSVEIIFDMIKADETQLVGETHANLFMSTRVRLHNVTE